MMIRIKIQITHPLTHNRNILSISYIMHTNMDPWRPLWP